jgi:peptidoglycan/LPS O-acetylase OafA/YrhL
MSHQPFATDRSFPAPANASARIECLDGLRGIAAMWVLLGHAMILTGWQVPVLGRPALAVDLFMMLSGFLMAFHYMERRARDPWHAPATWLTFWTRRFFRIAPLYYLLLAAALLAGPLIGGYRDEIAVVLPGTATEAARYLDQSWQNVLAHATFVFGFDPYYGFATPLPDWSIGLEMAFYAVFPFLMVLAARIGFLATAAIVSVGCVLLSRAFSDFFLAFNEPSLLAIKLPIFLAGMLVAASLQKSGWARLVLLAVALALCVLPVRGADGGKLVALIRCASLGTLALLADCHRLPAMAGFGWLMRRLAAIMGGRVARFLGDTSYGVYLLHLLVMIPAAALVMRWLQPGEPAIRFAVTLLVVMPSVYATAWLLHIAIERPGIRLGRQVLGALRTRRVARASAA